MRIRKRIELFIGSCNGLLSLLEKDGGIIICNPWLQKCKQIPPFFPYTFNATVKVDSNENMLFHMAYGFGYDAVSNDYKVVRILQFLIPDGHWKESRMTIYSALKDFSRVVKMLYLLRARQTMGVYVQGALHWIVTRFNDIGPRIIVGFDLVIGEFGEVPQPDYGGNVTSLDIGVLGGCLCVCAQFEDVGVDGWVMKEYGVKESWSKVFSIPSKVLCYESLRPLGYSQKGDAVLLELDMKKLLWYDMEKKRVAGIVIEGWEGDVFEAILCLNSLFQPKLEQPPKKERKTVKKRDDFLSTGFKLKL